MKKLIFRLHITIILFCILIPAGAISYTGDVSPDNKSVNVSSDTESAGIPSDNKKNADSSPAAIRFVFAGDVIFEKQMNGLMDKKGKDYILADTKSVLQAADLTAINLETPVSRRGIKEKDKQYTFRARPECVSILANAGIDIVSLANNHSLDYGRDALSDTFKYLKNGGLLYAGAGQNINEASMPVYIDRKGCKIAFIATSRVVPYITWHAGTKTSGVASTYNTNIIKKEITEARKKADIVVVYVHWGEERKEIPVKHQKDLARLYVDCGADIVIGSHPHILQGLEFYKGKLIAYSLGNFVFTDAKKDTMILSVTVENKKITTVGIIVFARITCGYFSQIA